MKTALAFLFLWLLAGVSANNNIKKLMKCRANHAQCLTANGGSGKPKARLECLDVFVTCLSDIFPPKTVAVCKPRYDACLSLAAGQVQKSEACGAMYLVCGSQ